MRVAKLLMIVVMLGLSASNLATPIVSPPQEEVAASVDVDASFGEEMIVRSATCSCPYKANLAVYVYKAVNLPDMDGIFNGKSDPYVSIWASKGAGNAASYSTRTIDSNLNPVWREWIEFGEGVFHRLKFDVLDEDNNRNWYDNLLTGAYIDLPTTGIREWRRICSPGCATYLWVYIISEPKCD